MAIPLLNDEFDTALRANVHPHTHANPSPKSRYQLVVIGGGPAGLVAAVGAASLGASVALVERDLLGGDCLTVGCVPSKTLLHAAKSGQRDFAATMTNVRRIRAELSVNDSAARLASLGIDVFFGNARFTGRDVVEVENVRLNFGRCIIATGARAKRPTLDGIAEVQTYTNESIFTLTALPRRLLVIGGGPIGCELGQAFAMLGSAVTIATHHARLLPKDDAEAAELLANRFRTQGIAIVETPPDPRLFDAVLLAAGRVPNVDSLNVSAADVAFDAERGIAVDAYQRTTNAAIFAAGDVCDTPYHFTHAADAMARVALQNALFPTKAKFAMPIPWATYTDPEVASVRVPCDDPTVEFRHDFRQLDRAVTDAAEGFVKIQVVNGSDRIVAATAVGPCAGELIGTLSVMMQNQIGLKAMAKTVLPYPTYTEAIKKLADQYNRTRLTPTAKWALRTWLRWAR